jgi:hypothetical protein
MYLGSCDPSYPEKMVENMEFKYAAAYSYSHSFGWCGPYEPKLIKIGVGEHLNLNGGSFSEEASIEASSAFQAQASLVEGWSKGKAYFSEEEYADDPDGVKAHQEWEKRPYTQAEKIQILGRIVAEYPEMLGEFVEYCSEAVHELETRLKKAEKKIVALKRQR